MAEFRKKNFKKKKKKGRFGLISGLTVFSTEKKRVFFKPIGHKSAKKGSKS